MADEFVLRDLSTGGNRSGMKGSPARTRRAALHMAGRSRRPHSDARSLQAPVGRHLMKAVCRARSQGTCSHRASSIGAPIPLGRECKCPAHRHAVRQRRCLTRCRDVRHIGAVRGRSSGNRHPTAPAWLACRLLHRCKGFFGANRAGSAATPYRLRRHRETTPGFVRQPFVGPHRSYQARSNRLHWQGAKTCSLVCASRLPLRIS